MANELMNSKAFQKGPAAAFGSLGMEESLSDGIGGGYPLLRIKGKVWAISLRGETHTFVDDKGYPAPFLDVIILRQAQNKSKAYFEGYEDGSKDAPVCTSSDGVVPDVGVLHKQSDTCAGCPRNVFKPNEKGIKVKECSDAKRLAVVPLPEQTKKLLGEPLIEPVFLRVPASSLGNLAAMGDEAKRKGFAYFTFVTRMDFDPDKSFPKIRFTAIQELSDAEAGKVLELREDPLSYRIIGGDGAGRQGVARLQAPAEQVKLAPPAPTGLVQAPPIPQEAAPNVTEASAKFEADRQARLQAVKAAAAAEEAAAAVTKAADQAVQPSLQKTLELTATAVEAGLTGLVSPAPAPAIEQAKSATPVMADDAMNAAINALLPSKK